MHSPCARQPALTDYPLLLYPYSLSAISTHQPFLPELFSSLRALFSISSLSSQQPCSSIASHPQTHLSPPLDSNSGGSYIAIRCIRVVLCKLACTVCMYVRTYVPTDSLPCLLELALNVYTSYCPFVYRQHISEEFVWQVLFQTSLALKECGTGRKGRLKVVRLWHSHVCEQKHINLSNTLYISAHSSQPQYFFLPELKHEMVAIVIGYEVIPYNL